MVTPIIKPVEKHRVAEEVVEQLRSNILQGTYPPGSRLPPERELAKTLGVNRASLREALKKLEHLGLVRIRQGDGTRVRNFMETGGIELVQHLLPLAATRPELVRDLLEFRCVLGRELARLATQKLEGVTTANDTLMKLSALADQADRVVGAEELFLLDFEFYVTMAQLTGNQIMVLLINTVKDAVKPYAKLLANLTNVQGHARKHHRQLLLAFAARDADKAARVAHEYLSFGLTPSA